MRLRWWRRRGDPLVCREFVELVTDYLEGTLPAADLRRIRVGSRSRRIARAGGRAVARTAASIAAPARWPG